jgi:hypothetical protein
MYGSTGTEEEEGLAKVLELIVGIQIVFSDEVERAEVGHSSLDPCRPKSR